MYAFGGFDGCGRVFPGELECYLWVVGSLFTPQQKMTAFGAELFFSLQRDYPSSQSYQDSSGKAVNQSWLLNGKLVSFVFSRLISL